jgi:hypothetical protein
MAPTITLEKLAEMVAEGFLELGHRMAVIQNDFERLREGLANLRLVVEHVSTSEHGMVCMRDYLALEHRVGALEEYLKEVLQKP